MNVLGNEKVLQSRFVFKRKMNEDGTVARCNARLVVEVSMQGPADHSYAPVVDLTTVGFAWSLAVHRGCFVQQVDARTSFCMAISMKTCTYLLHGGAGIEVRNGQALRLKKGLYGLRQAPRLWYEKWLEVKTRFRLEALLSDKSVFRIWKMLVFL